MKRLVITAASLALGLGTACALQGCSAECCHKSEHKSDENEVKVKMEECPAPVQETLKKEIGSGKLEDIARETKHGKTIYEADVEIGGKKYEIKVASDGTLLAKKLEDEKEEKEEKGK